MLCCPRSSPARFCSCIWTFLRCVCGWRCCLETCRQGAKRVASHLERQPQRGSLRRQVRAAFFLRSVKAARCCSFYSQALASVHAPSHLHNKNKLARAGKAVIFIARLKRWKQAKEAPPHARKRVKRESMQES